MKWSLFKRKIKFWWQRQTRGWDDSDTWNLDCKIAEFILPRLKRFKQISPCVPSGFSDEEWQAVLDEMIYAIEKIATEVHYEDTERVSKGLSLLWKYYNCLWW